MKENTWLIVQLFIPAVGLFFALASCAAPQAHRTPEYACDLEPDPVTGIAEVSVKKARELLDQADGHIYVDVRTVPEFIEGHPPGALNIPVLVPDADSGAMALNRDFMRVVMANIPLNKAVIVGCRSGGRSARAVQLMMDAGYVHVHDMLGGFYGAMDDSGQIIRPGWSGLGYPSEEGDGAARSFQSLVTARPESGIP